jgi:hypothetical protein
MFLHADLCKEIISYRFIDAYITSIHNLQIISPKIHLTINAMYVFSLIFSKQRNMTDKLRHFTLDIQDKFWLETRCRLFYVESVHYRHVQSKAVIMCMVCVTSASAAMQMRCDSLVWDFMQLKVVVPCQLPVPAWKRDR